MNFWAYLLRFFLLSGFIPCGKLPLATKVKMSPSLLELHSTTSSSATCNDSTFNISATTLRQGEILRRIKHEVEACVAANTTRTSTTPPQKKKRILLRPNVGTCHPLVFTSALWWSSIACALPCHHRTCS